MTAKTGDRAGRRPASDADDELGWVDRAMGITPTELARLNEIKAEWAEFDRFSETEVQAAILKLRHTAELVERMATRLEDELVRRGGKKLILRPNRPSVRAGEIMRRIDAVQGAVEGWKWGGERRERMLVLEAIEFLAERLSGVELKADVLGRLFRLRCERLGVSAKFSSDESIASALRAWGNSSGRAKEKWTPVGKLMKQAKLSPLKADALAADWRKWRTLKNGEK